MIQIIQHKKKLYWILFTTDTIAKTKKLKKDNKGIRLIKKYVFNIYKLMKGTSPEDE